MCLSLIAFHGILAKYFSLFLSVLRLLNMSIHSNFYPDMIKSMFKKKILQGFEYKRLKHTPAHQLLQQQNVITQDFNNSTHCYKTAASLKSKMDSYTHFSCYSRSLQILHKINV